MNRNILVSDTVALPAQALREILKKSAVLDSIEIHGKKGKRILIKCQLDLESSIRLEYLDSVFFIVVDN